MRNKTERTGMFGFLRRFFAHDLAMDLGTANTLLSSAREDMLVNEPSVVLSLIHI